MEENFHYNTVTDAINRLRKQGFIIDFNLKGDWLIGNREKFEAEDFKIVEVYRYEGNSDPADEAIVYGIESNSGLKGILVKGYGISSDYVSNEILKKFTTYNQYRTHQD
jgi:NADPH:quinone reductase